MIPSYTRRAMRFNFIAPMLLSCLSFMATAQSVYDDFEGNGNITTWFGDACNINTGYSNPFAQGINTSPTVLEYADTGGQYANVRFEINNTFDLATEHAFSLKIYVPSSGLTGNQNNQISLKLQDGTLGQPWTTQSEIIKPLTLNQWQTITFDFQNDPYINLDGNSPPPTQRTDFNRVVIQVNGENNTDHVLAYLDDIAFDGAIVVDPVYDHLIWSDEFDTDGPIDQAKWFHQTRLPTPGSWYNGEIQHYTNRTANSVVENGILKITAKKETFTDQGFTKTHTSARLNAKFAFTYGKVEVRAKLPRGVGTWPAIWMLGKNVNENGAYWDNEGFGTTPWPACGEVDIMEHWGHNQNYVQSAMHTPSSYGATVNLGGQTVPTASDEFHVYTLEWSPLKMVFSVDDVTHYTYEPAVKDASTWPFDADQYLLLNVAIQPGIESGFTQSAMEVDYVRVYQESPVSTAVVEHNADQLSFPNPVDDEIHITLPDTDDAEASLKLYGLDGKVIHSTIQPVRNNMITLSNIGHLAPGMYVIVYVLNHQSFSLKFLKN
jgi:beta-glucanase (GH16 family)